jgi:hypothetical protein
MSKDDSSRQMINAAALQAAEQLPTQQSVAQHQSSAQLNVPEMQSPVQAQIADRLPREHPSDDRSDWERPSVSTDPRWKPGLGGLPLHSPAAIGLRSDTCASGAVGVASPYVPARYTPPSATITPPPLPEALRGLTPDECRRIGDTLVELGEWLRRRA